MSLLQRIKDDQIQARKGAAAGRTGAPLVASLLTTLYSEAANVGLNDGKRESTDAEVIATIKKFIKGIDETLAVRPDEGLLTERAILEGYLPKQLSDHELHAAVVSIVEEIHAVEFVKNMKQMGRVMAALKERFGGQYDGKKASEFAKAALTS